MKITIAKENGEFQVALDGEQVGPMKVSREIDLFPGQSARISAKVFFNGGEVLEVELLAGRNGETKGFTQQKRLHSQFPLDAKKLIAEFPVRRWIAELTAWAKKIPLREEVEIEF